MEHLLWTHLGKLSRKLSSISLGNPKIHRVILLVYLTSLSLDPFPENKLHSMEIGGCIFVPWQQSPKDAGRWKNCPQWNPWLWWPWPATPLTPSCERWIPLQAITGQLICCLWSNELLTKSEKTELELKPKSVWGQHLLLWLLYCAVAYLSARVVQMEKKWDVLTWPERKFSWQLVHCFEINLYSHSP